MSEKNNQESYAIFFRGCKKLLEKKNEYLKAFTNEAEYVLLDELYKKFPTYYNKYALSVLHTPLKLSDPVNPDTAAIIKAAIGGTAEGIVAAMDAGEREAAYRQNALDVIESQVETGTVYEQLNKCYLTIIAIINTKESTKNDWNITIHKEREEERKKANAEIMKKHKLAIVFLIICMIVFLLAVIYFYPY